MNKVIKKISKALLIVPVFALMVGFTMPIVSSPLAHAECDISQGLQGGIDCGKQAGNKNTDLFGEGGVFTTIINVLLFLIGVMSVIMLIYGGVQYVISSGDSGKVNSAKNTILYAIVGLVVAILAYAIVRFVVTTFLNPNN